MNAGGGQDDEFGDDLDLPAGTIEDLDRDAATLSQRLQQRLTGHVSSKVRVNGLRAQAGPNHETSDYQNPPSSDYGFDDEDVIDLDDPDLLLAQNVAHDAGQGRQNGLGELATRPARHDTNVEANDLGMNELRIRLAELEQDRAVLQKTLDDVQSDATAKAGAIAILRSKHEKSTKEYERKLSVMQQLHADDIANQKKELELARKEQETVKTNNRFLEHDLAQELERTKSLKAPKVPAPTALPASSRPGPPPDRYSDGFDHDEMILVSPAKAVKTEGKIVTPKKNRKRKREDNSSPTVPLDIAEEYQDPPELITSPTKGVSMLNKLHDRSGANVWIVQRVLDYIPLGESQRAIEVMAKYKSPEDEPQSMASVFLHGLSAISCQDDGTLHTDIYLLCINLWRQCLSSSYFEPINLLVDLVDFLSSFSSSTLGITTVAKLVQVITGTIDLVAVPRALAARASASPTAARDWKAKRTAHTETLDVDTCLQLLHSMAIEVSLKQDDALAFWQGMEFDFVLLMLHKAQPMHHITLMLQMVASSSTMNTFGVVVNTDPQRQSKNEADMLDRLTLLCFESLTTDDVVESYAPEDYANLRLEIVSTLRSISATEHGSKSLAQHKTAFGRLVRFLHAQMTYLYDISPAIDSDPDGEPSLHTLVIQTVNLITRILYHLMHEHAELINIREKLSVVHGGHHKFLVALSRIAFSERLAFEAGLENEVVDAAHEILDAVLSPEEGDAVVKAVQTPRTVASRTSVSAATSAAGA